MASRTYRTPVGTDLNHIAGQSWQIGGIRVDNPTGSWLLVDSINQFIPPYTNGWQADFIPAASSLSIKFVDSPSGSVSTLVGDPLTVTLYDTPVGASQGFSSGAGGKVGIVPPNKSSAKSFVAGASGGLSTILLPKPGVSYVITSLSIMSESGQEVQGFYLRGIAFVSLQDLLNVLAVGAISPETPSWQLNVPLGGIVTMAGSTVWVQGTSLPSVGQSVLFAFLTYYEQLPK